MIVFQDILTESELFSDAFDIKVEDTHYYFFSKYVKRAAGGIDDRLIGGNASAEEQQDQMDDQDVKCGLDFFLDNRLAEFAYEKKAFGSYFKDYLKKVEPLLAKEEKMADRMEGFRVRAQTFFKQMMALHKDLVFYFGELDEDYAGTCCCVKFNDDGSGAEVWVFRDGVREVKY